MALAAYQVRDESVVKQRIFLKEAAATIGHARPTTANRMLQITHHALQAAELAFERGTSVKKQFLTKHLNHLIVAMRQCHVWGLFVNKDKCKRPCIDPVFWRDNRGHDASRSD